MKISHLLFCAAGSYIGIRYTIPKKDVVFTHNTIYDGKIIGTSHVDCILFDSLKIWRDGDLCYSTNYYYWRKVNPMII